MFRDDVDESVAINEHHLIHHSAEYRRPDPRKMVNTGRVKDMGERPVLNRIADVAAHGDVESFPVRNVLLHVRLHILEKFRRRFPYPSMPTDNENLVGY